MRNNKRKQTITIVALVVAILSLSIGFAAFSNVLNISSRASVDPDSGRFKVVFASNEAGNEFNDITPTKTPNTLVTTDGQIDNTTNPTIENMHVTFTEPGQKAEYNFYVHNSGSYLAYLNSITFKGIKTCTPASGTTDAYVQEACNSIIMTVSIDGIDATETTQDITGKTLSVGASKSVKVTIEYVSTGARADGNFTVSFPDVSMYYVTTGGINEQYTYTANTSSCQEVVIGTEKFCLLSETNTTRTLLAQKNITLSTTNPVQSDEAGTLAFTNIDDGNGHPYWIVSTGNTKQAYNNYDVIERDGAYYYTIPGMGELQITDPENIQTVDEYAYNSNYSPYGNSEYPYVYDSNSNLKQYVDAYRNTLTGLGANVQNARLASYEEIVSLSSKSDIREGAGMAASLMSGITNEEAQEYINQNGMATIEAALSNSGMTEIWNYNTFSDIDKAKLAKVLEAYPMMGEMIINNSNVLSFPNWIANTLFWCGSADDGNVWVLLSTMGMLSQPYNGDLSAFGIRPVITIIK